MKRAFFFSFFVAVFIPCASGFSQNGEIRFDHLSIRDGLSQSTINCILQDNKGFMWFGTQDGLNKYNGYDFVVFRHDPFDSTTIIDNYVRAIYQDTAGIIWIGTDRGFCLFDPVTNTFQSFAKNHSGPGSRPIRGIAEDNRGMLWIGTENNGVYRFNKSTNTFKHFAKNTASAGITSNKIRFIMTDSEGEIWIGTWNKGVFKYDDADGTFAQPATLSGLNVWTIAEDAQGNLFMGTDNGLIEMMRSSRQIISFVYNPNDPSSLSNNNVRSVFIDHTGSIWVGTDLGLDEMIIEQGRVRFLHNRHNVFVKTSITNNLVQSVYEDQSSTIWVGTNNGLSKFDPSKQGFRHLQNIPDNPQSLANNNVWAICEDRQHNLWIGTRKGLDRIGYDDHKFTHYTGISNSPVFKANPSVYSILCDKENKLWVGTADGLYQTVLMHQHGRPLQFIHMNYCDKYFNQQQENRVYTIRQDKQGNIWVGTRNGLGIIRIRDKTHRFFTHSDSLGTSISNNTIRAIYQDEKEDIWIGTEKGLNKVIFKGDSIVGFRHYYHTYGTKNCLSNDMVLNICKAGNGKMWIGTYGGGINLFNPLTGEFTQYTEKNGLPNDVIYGILSDHEGNLWMSTNKGLSYFHIPSGSFKNYEEEDGLQSNEFNTGAYYKNASGELFFGGINGLNVFNPEDIQVNPYPPKMVITGLKVYNKSISMIEGMVVRKEISSAKQIILNYEQDHFELEFAALHYSSPQRNKYQFKMVGFDQDWIDAGSRRVAAYTNLDPGSYIFLVKGCNSDGIWSEEVASVKIIITPPFWNTWWFRMLALLFFISMIFGWIKYRERNIRLQKEFLEHQVHMRTEEIIKQKEKIEMQKEAIQKEKEKVDTLLLNILPESTVEELKSKGRANARHYRKVSVMFADIQNFTKLSEELRPNQLVEMLDELFIKFDEIISKYNIEKIKTIGDAYMCAGGVPIRNRSNPIEIVLAGLQMQEYMEKNKEKHQQRGLSAWNIRIGIHTGPVTAGILGKKRFAYDIWGDTVNVANRMESAGKIGSVNISDKTCSEVRDFFICQYRGKFKVKNKGEIPMYFVQGIHPELSVNGEGKEPNDLFWQYVNLKLYSSINYKKAEKYIIRLLKSKLPVNLYYHCLEHTLDVCKAAERIGLAENIKGEDLFLLKTAALFHDAGFIRQYEHHEEESAELAREILPKYGYSDQQVDVVARLILATKIPQNPQSHLEEIICDADLDYLGRNDFSKISNALMRELLSLNMIKTEKQWDEIQIKFLTNHTFFTKTARETRQSQKRAYLRQIMQKVENNTY